MSRVISLHISILDHSNVVTCSVLFFWNTFIAFLNAICIIRKCSDARILYSSICIVLILCRNYHPSITVCSCQAVRVNTDVSTTYNYSRCVLVTLVSSRVILIQIDVAIKCNLCSSNAFWHIYTVFSACIVLRPFLSWSRTKSCFHLTLLSLEEGL